MGICIAYRGKLREPALVGELVTDLEAKADAVGWPCKTMAELVAERRYAPELEIKDDSGYFVDQTRTWRPSSPAPTTWCRSRRGPSRLRPASAR